MDVACKYNYFSNDSIMAPAIIRHVFGNVLRLSIPLTHRVVNIVDGAVEEKDSDFIPNPDFPVRVILKGPKEIVFEGDMDENTVSIVDRGELPIGTYSITILCRDMNEDPMRFKANLILRVVDCTAEAYNGGIGWYEGLDGQSVYPILTADKTPGLVVGDNDVTITEEEGFKGQVVLLNETHGKSNVTTTAKNVNINL